MSVITTSSVLVAVFLGTFVAPARAEEIVTVRIPFPFVVDHKEFPAGRYDIRTADDSGEAIWIEGMNNRSATVALTIPAEGRDPAGAQPALVFIRSEDEYQLSQIWASGNTGRELTGLSDIRRLRHSETSVGAPTHEK
jgi:hypothetical protein